LAREARMSRNQGRWSGVIAEIPIAKAGLRNCRVDRLETGADPGAIGKDGLALDIDRLLVEIRETSGQFGRDENGEDHSHGGQPRIEPRTERFDILQKGHHLQTSIDPSRWLNNPIALLDPLHTALHKTSFMKYVSTNDLLSQVP
jgi:hypothetical protein